jgi:hypothetical protein
MARFPYRCSAVPWKGHTKSSPVCLAGGSAGRTGKDSHGLPSGSVGLAGEHRRVPLELGLPALGRGGIIDGPQAVAFS